MINVQNRFSAANSSILGVTVQYSPPVRPYIHPAVELRIAGNLKQQTPLVLVVIDAHPGLPRIV
jgi:hypothetical protein